MGQSMYYMSSFSIPTTNPCITWVSRVLHGLITHVIHVLGMYYMSCSCITWVSIPIMHPCNAWVPMHYMMHYMGSHALHGTPQVLHEDAHHTCASNWCPTAYSSCCRCKTHCPQSRADNPLFSQHHFSVAMYTWECHVVHDLPCITW